MRDSILEIARGWNEFKVTERRLTIDELTKASREGRILEAFGSGTAVVVCPIEEYTYKDETFKVPLNPKYKAGDITHRLLN